MRDTLYIAVPADAPGFSIIGDWDPLGMRGTVSRTLVFKDVFVPDDAQMMPRGVYFQAAIALAAHVHDAVADLHGHRPGGLRLHRADTCAARCRACRRSSGACTRPSRSRWPRCCIKLEQTRALFLRASTRRGSIRRRTSACAAYAAQYTIMENANDIARLAIRTCGGQSMLKSLPLERLYRDSRCGSLMLPWTAELCLDRIGREALYEPGEVDD